MVPSHGFGLSFIIAFFALYYVCIADNIGSLRYGKYLDGILMECPKFTLTIGAVNRLI